MNFLEELEQLLRERNRTRPENSYTSNLFREGDDRILKKVIEEAGEVLLAAKNNAPDEIRHEAADLVFHLLVLLVHKGVSLQEILDELKRRHK